MVIDLNVILNILLGSILAMLGWFLNSLNKKISRIEQTLHESPCGELRNLSGRFDERGDAEKQLMSALVLLKSVLAKHQE